MQDCGWQAFVIYLDIVKQLSLSVGNSTRAGKISPMPT
jgi:hypothetical protein